MQNYLNWKHQLLKSSNNSEVFFIGDHDNKNLFQYKYKYFNNIIQKSIENGFYFPAVNLKNSEFYYLGKHFISNSFSGDLDTLIKKNLNKLSLKKLKKEVDVDQSNYINISNYVPETYYSLNLIKYLPLVNSSLHSFDYSNVTFLENQDGSIIDLINFGIFDLVVNTENTSNVLYYYFDSSSDSNVEPEFIKDSTVISSVYSKGYSKYQSKSMVNRVAEYIDTFTGRNFFLSDFVNTYLNSDIDFNSLLSCDSIHYETFTVSSDISDVSSDDYLYTYLFTHLDSQLNTSVKSKLRSRYNSTIAYIEEVKLLKEIDLKNKAAEAKIIDDFDNHRIGERKKQRLLLALYNKQKNEELKRDEDKKKSQIPEIKIENYSNLDSSLDDLNDVFVRKNISFTPGEGSTNDVYQYEYENLGNLSVPKNVFFSDIDGDNIDVAHLDYLNKINYYESNLNIRNKRRKIKLVKQNKFISDQQRSVRLMNCLNDLLNYSESHNFDIEQPSNVSAELHLSKQYKFFKSLFTSYKSNNKFPILYIPHLSNSITKSQLGNQINKNVISMYRKKNIHVQLIAPSMKGLFYYPNINLQDNKFNYYMYWDINCLYYKFIGLLIRHGKRHKAEYILNNSFLFIKNLSLCNPLYIFMKALYNGQTFFEFTKQKKQTKSLLIPRYTPLNKRIKISMRSIAQNIRNSDTLRKVMKSKKHKVNTSYLLSNILISYFFKIGKVKNDLITNVTNAYKQKHLLKKNAGTFVYNRLLKFLAFRKIRGYHISK